MKILITGSNGFIGKNLCLSLKNKGHKVFAYDLDSPAGSLEQYISSCDFIVHLAGVNRPADSKEYVNGNVDFTKKLLDNVKAAKSKVPILFASSVQATLNNPYGQSKKAAEELLLKFAKENNQKVYIYRLANVFGRWCQPNYNSVIATFCYNLANGLPISVDVASKRINFVYIDDVCDEFLKVINKAPTDGKPIRGVHPLYQRTPAQIAGIIRSFKGSRESLMVPFHDEFGKKLYSTFLTYLNPQDFAYPLLPHVDDRGTFAEMLKTLDNGQISLNLVRSGITKGNHYHLSKTEKYFVVSGICEIKFRKIDGVKIISYACSGTDLRAVDIPPGYTHCITNTGKEDALVIMWASDLFDKVAPDTYPLLVEDKK
jgi:UDP-2-acetamido-2,6-beta-L-arabino-hexul-4-ose reductase